MIAKEINLYWHNYKFFPYEKKFAIREVQSLLNPKNLEVFDDRLCVIESANYEELKKLVYFSHAKIEKETFPTLQYGFENGSGQLVRQKRQNTRYSVHGLHEYKGKFNPQVVRSLFNIYNIKPGDLILDPFCGSGTTLVEAAHDNILAKGTDINPLAVFIANTKIEALSVSADKISASKEIFFIRFKEICTSFVIDNNDDRIIYLRKWFPEDNLRIIEAFRLAAMELNESIRNIYLVIISNLLRDYSFQEPTDLRIRRRFSPFPETSIIQQLEIAINFFASNLKEFQTALSPFSSNNRAFNLDIKLSNKFKEFDSENIFDFAITSPPYATALPYIDTQRLSLVWLNLISSKEIKGLESELIGSREFNLKSQYLKWYLCLINNKSLLPEEIHSFCISLNKKLKASEGFRKKALPPLLYRYFNDMAIAFKEVYRLLKKDKYFCLIVGHNHTTIGGTRTDIDTPKLLSYLGRQIGFEINEIVELEAYQRYGLNSSNAVQKESLIVFKK